MRGEPLVHTARLLPVRSPGFDVFELLLQEDGILQQLVCVVERATGVVEGFDGTARGEDGL